MVGGLSSTPPTGGAPSPDGNDPLKGDSNKNFEQKPMKWLGMQFDSKEATQLWKVIIQSLNSEIEKDKEKTKEAFDDMNQAMDGQDDS